MSSSRSRRKTSVREIDQLTVPDGGTATAIDLCEDWCAEYGTNTLPPGVRITGIIVDWAVDVTTAGAATHNLLVTSIGVRNETTLSEVDGPVSEQHASWMMYEPRWMGATTADRQFDVPLFRTVVRTSRLIRGLGDRLVMTAQAVDGAYTIDVAASVFMTLP